MLIVKNRLSTNFSKELERLKDCIKHHNLAVWEFDYGSGRILFDDFNTNTLGYEANKIEKLEDFLNITHPEERENLLKEISARIASNAPFNKEIRLKCKDGMYKWFSLSGKAFETDVEGNPEKINGILSDIDDVKIKTEALKESHKLARMGRWDYYHNTGQLTWDENVYEIFELTPEDYQAEYSSFLNKIHPDDRKNVDLTWKNSLMTRAPYNIIHRILLQNGAIKWIKEFCSNEFSEDGKPLHSLGIVQDITDLKTAEENISKNHKKLEKLLQKTEEQKQQIYCLYKISRAVLTNTAIGEILNILLNDYKNHVEVDSGYMILLNDDGEEKKVLKIGEPDAIQYVDTHPDLTQFEEKEAQKRIIVIKLMNDSRVSGFLILEKKEGQFSQYAFKTIHTIAELLSIAIQKQALIKKLKTEKEKAEAANKAKDDFLSIMSHELRTPLNGVIGFSELLKKTTLDVEQDEFVDIIFSSAQRLLNMISAILDFSKLESKNLKLYPEKIRFSNMIDDIISMIREEASKKSLSFKLSIAEDIPDYVEVDSLRLKQILIYLLSNAVKFTDEGYVELKIEKCETISEMDQVNIRFSIIDSGIGIKKEDQQKIFRKFQQIDMSSTRKYGGAGLGLSITNKLLQKMNSHLELKSEYGKGSNFSFCISLPYIYVKR